MRYDNKISEVLQAALSCLWDGNPAITPHYSDFPEYICQAIALASGWDWLSEPGRRWTYAAPATRFLGEMGMSASAAGFLNYRNGDWGPPIERQTQQHLRMVWLQLAIQVAQEEGL